MSGSARQAQLRRFPRGCEIIPFAADEAHEVGALLAAATTTDVVDAHVVVTARRLRASVLTSDAAELAHLVAQLEPRIAIHLR